MEPGIAILLCVVALVLGAGVSGFICFKQGISYRKKTAEAAVGSAEKEAERIVDDAKKNAETLKKEALIEAKDEIHKSRQETEKELKERRWRRLTGSRSHSSICLKRYLSSLLIRLRIICFQSWTRIWCMKRL